MILLGCPIQLIKKISLFSFHVPRLLIFIFMSIVLSQLRHWIPMLLYQNLFIFIFNKVTGPAKPAISGVDMGTRILGQNGRWINSKGIPFERNKTWNDVLSPLIFVGYTIYVLALMQIIRWSAIETYRTSRITYR